MFIMFRSKNHFVACFFFCTLMICGYTQHLKKAMRKFGCQNAMRAGYWKHNCFLVWTNNIFIKNTLEMHVEMSEIEVINDNNNSAPFLFPSLCKIFGDCSQPQYFRKKTSTQNNITSDFTQ